MATRRIVCWLVVALAASGAFIGTGPAEATQSNTYVYGPNDGGHILWPEYVAFDPIEQATGVDAPRPLLYGALTVKASTSSVVVTLKDAAVPDGTPVAVRADGVMVCITAGQPSQIGGLTPGQYVTIQVITVAETTGPYGWYGTPPAGCPRSSTAGTISVTF